MNLYVAESFSFSVDHAEHQSRGVLGENKGSEKIYLHVLALSDAEIAKLGPRLDENGNREHSRLALANNEEWWLSVDGEVAWPKLYRPRITSRCDLTGSKPIPVPIGPDDIERLRKAGVELPRV